MVGMALDGAIPFLDQFVQAQQVRLLYSRAPGNLSPFLTRYTDRTSPSFPRRRIPAPQRCTCSKAWMALDMAGCDMERSMAAALMLSINATLLNFASCAGFLNSDSRAGIELVSLEQNVSDNQSCRVKSCKDGPSQSNCQIFFAERVT